MVLLKSYPKPRWSARIRLLWIYLWFVKTGNCQLRTDKSNLRIESIEISYQSGNLNVAGPESMTVGGESVDFQIAVASTGETPAGTYDINVSVVVTEWNGVPVSVFGFSDEDVVEVEVQPYTVCSSSRPSAIFSEAGEDVLFSVVYSCDSNESSLEVSLHLLEEVVRKLCGPLDSMICLWILVELKIQWAQSTVISS